MIGLKNENEELGDSTYDYILAIETIASIYIFSSINNELLSKKIGALRNPKNDGKGFDGVFET